MPSVQGPIILAGGHNQIVVHTVYHPIFLWVLITKPAVLRRIFRQGIGWVIEQLPPVQEFKKEFKGWLKEYVTETVIGGRGRSENREGNAYWLVEPDQVPKDLAQSLPPDTLQVWTTLDRSKWHPPDYPGVRLLPPRPVTGGLKVLPPQSIPIYPQEERNWAAPGDRKPAIKLLPPRPLPPGSP